MNNLINFNNVEFGELRVLEINDKPYVIATDIAKSLGYSNPHKAINDHCKKVRKICTNDSLGRPQEINVIPEGDIYRLITRSKLPKAEKFESWVFDEVLPSIRKNGTYQLKGLSKELQAIFAIDKKQQEIETKVDYLYDHMTIDYEQQGNLNQLARHRAVELLGGKTSNAYKRVSKKLFAELWRDYKRYFKVNSYKNTATKEYDNAREYLIKWCPSNNLRMEIEAINAQYSFVG